MLELVSGRPLSDELSGGPLSEEATRRIGCQVAEALDYLHGQGVVHRDVKPANVLLGRGNVVKLSDLGAAVVRDRPALTQPGMTLGTAAYLSPEQVRGVRALPPSDVYALGLVLLECLTGVRAYAGPPTEAALARLDHPPHIPAGLAPAWMRLLTAMTDVHPAARPTARQVADQLARHLGATPAAADVAGAAVTQLLPADATLALPGLPTRDVDAPHRSRRRAAVAAGLLLFALLLGGGYASVSHHGRAGRPVVASDPAPSSEPSRTAPVSAIPTATASASAAGSDTPAAPAGPGALAVPGSAGSLAEPRITPPAARVAGPAHGGGAARGGQASRPKGKGPADGTGPAAPAGLAAPAAGPAGPAVDGAPEGRP